jgi:hypothetical protein
MRKLFLRAGSLAVIVFALAAHGVVARVHERWPAAKLAERADVVVIARFISTKDAKNTDKAPEPFPDLVGVESTFRVLAVIKGKLERKQIVVFHFRYPKAARHEKGANNVSRDADEVKARLVSFRQTPDIDGPCLLRFEPDPDDPPRYLMFLKKRKDGRYECVSGQVDPNVSVNKLEGPSNDIDE